jgi:hypothetical protein
MKFLSVCRIVFIIPSLVSLLSVVSCGGGGGGEGGSESSETGVRILHGAIDAAPVDLVTSAAPSKVLQTVRFAERSTYSQLGDGSQTLTLTRTQTPSVVIGTFPRTIASSGRYSVLLFGDNATFGLNTRFIENVVPESITGTALRVVNGMTGATEVVVTVVPQGGSRADGSVVRAGYGLAAEYAGVPSGPVRITATRAADGLVVSSIDATLSAGDAYTFFVAGEAEYYVKGVLLED